MDAPTIFIGAAWLVTLAAWLILGAVDRARAHNERMEMLKLIKADNLREFMEPEKKPPSRQNAYVKQIKQFGGGGGNGEGESNQ